MFWLGSGLLLYGAGTFLFALFSRVLFLTIVPNDVFDAFWNTQQMLFIVFCLFATIGFWVSRYENRQTA